MAARVFKYPFDETGKSRDNACVEERKLEREYNRAIAPYGGDFYSKSLVVENAETGKPLVSGVDYLTFYVNKEAEARTGKPVHSIIYIKNKEIDNVRLRYQVPGGLYSTSVSVLTEMIKDIFQRKEDIHWNDIFGKPTEFNPTPHLHHASDLYGMEFVVLALEELSKAILEGDNASHDILYDYINRIKEKLDKFIEQQENQNKDFAAEIEKLNIRCDVIEANLAALNAKLDTHINDYGNPHKTTKAQVGLSDVENYPVATKDQAEGGLNHSSYMTPLRTRESSLYFWEHVQKPYVDAHINDQNNPHKVTKMQVGLGFVDNFPTATKAVAEKGESNSHFMTPLRTKEAIDIFAGELLKAHIDDHDNPHQVTKAQVGLSNVPNWYPCTVVNAATNTAADQFVSPAYVNEHWLKKVQPYIDAHSNRTDNPHKVTPQQIGALPNYHTVNGKLLSTNPWLNAKDVGTLSESEIRNLLNGKMDKPSLGPNAQIGVGQMITVATTLDNKGWQSGKPNLIFNEVYYPGQQVLIGESTSTRAPLVMGFPVWTEYYTGVNGADRYDATMDAGIIGRITYGKWRWYGGQGYVYRGDRGRVRIGNMMRVE